MILRTELRRSAAPVIGVGVLLFTVGMLYGMSGPWWKGTAPWHEQWTGLAQWVRYLGVFLWPLLLGAGAWHGLRDRRAGVRELLSSTPRSAWRRVLPTAGALAIGLAGAFVVVLVVGGVQVALTASYFHVKWVPVAAVGLLAYLGAVLLGAGLGRLVPSLLTPPVLAVGGVAVQISLIQSGWPEWLTPTIEAPEITVFTTVSVPVTLVQALWFAAIAATGFGLLAANQARLRLAALLPVVLGLAITVPVLSQQDSHVADRDAVAMVCDEQDGRVCVTRAHEAELARFAGPAREALALLAKLPDAPTSVEELADERPRDGVVAVSLFGDGVRGSEALDDPADIRLSVLAGAGTPLCVDGSEETYRWAVTTRMAMARTVAAAWFTGELAPLPYYREMPTTEGAAVQRVWRTFRALPETAQRARVAELRDAALDCDPAVDLLDILVAP